MSRSTNFMILSFLLLQTGGKVSSKGTKQLVRSMAQKNMEQLKNHFKKSSVTNYVNMNCKIKISEKELPEELFLAYDYGNVWSNIRLFVPFV